MPTLAFGEYRPDVSDLDGQHTRNLSNVIPRADGYGPVRDVAALTLALPAQCRGYFVARNTDRTITVFAGTVNKLYRLNNTLLSWEDVSAAAGTYTDLDTTAQWSFAQFGSRVIATQANDDVQSYVLGSSSEFADLGGSPPDAAYVTVVGQFVVLSGLTANPFRIHWSAIGDATGWTAGTASSDFQDLPDGGAVLQVLGGEIGAIFQEAVIRRMVFSPGSDVIFVIERIAKDVGLLHPYGATAVGDKIFFLSPKGFMMTDTSGGLTPIGAERVDRTFFENYDPSVPQYVIAAADPKSHLVLWSYRTLGSLDDSFNALLAYNWVIQRWVPITASGEYITTLSQPGLTIEGLDAVAPGAMSVTGAADNGSGLIRITVADTDAAPYPIVTGEYRTLSGVGGTTEANGTWEVTRISGTTFDLVGSAFANAWTSGGIVGGSADLMEISWDAISTATLPNLSVADTDHKFGFFSGANLEAILETSEQSGDGQRLLVNGFWPVSDSATIHGKVGKRENLNSNRTYTDEVTMNSFGFVPTIRSTRYATGLIRIPSATAWSFASGVRPESQADGEA